MSMVATVNNNHEQLDCVTLGLWRHKKMITRMSQFCFDVSLFLVPKPQANKLRYVDGRGRSMYMVELSRRK